LGCCILYVDILYVLWTFIHCQTYDLKIFFPILSVVFLPCWHYPSMSQILKVLMKSSLSCFFITCVFGVISKMWLSNSLS
jgi:hypothetical protein